MKKKLILVLILVVIASLLVGCKTGGVRSYNKDILTNGEFEYEDLTKLREDWTLSAGESDVSSVFSLDDNAVRINTSTSGYASVSQRLYLQSFSYYKVTYKFNTTSMSEMDESKRYIGLFVGFQENPDFNISDIDNKVEQRGSSAGTKTSTYYLKTNALREANISINIGTKDNPVSTTSVLIDNIKVERVKKAEVTANSAYSFFELSSTQYGITTERNVVFVVLGTLATLLIAYFGYLLLARNNHLSKNVNESKFYKKFNDSGKKALLLTLAIAAGVRLLIFAVQTIIAATMKTHFFGFEIDNLLNNAEWIAKYGTAYFFQYNPGTVFQPVILLITSLIGFIIKPFAYNAVLGASLVKFIMILADIGVVLIIFKLAKEKLGNVGSIILASIYAVMPIMFTMSTVWGLTESLALLFLTLTFLFVLKKKYVLMSCVYLLAVATSKIAIFVLPMILLYIIVQLIVNKNMKFRLTVPACFVGGFIGYYILALPFTIVQIYAKGGSIFAPYKMFMSYMLGEKIYTANAFNFQMLLNNNFRELTTQSTFVSIIFLLFMVAIVSVVYIKNRSRLDLVLLSAGLIASIFSFTNNMTPQSMLFVLPLLMIYVALTGEKRVLACFAMFAALMFINMGYVFSVLGYTDAGVGMIEGSNAFAYIFSALNVITTIYFIYIIYDIVIAKKALPISTIAMPFMTYFMKIGSNVKIVLNHIGSKVKNVFSKNK